MPIDPRIALGVQGVDPNAAVNAMVTGAKLGQLRRQEAAQNALAAYLSGPRTPETRNALAAASPEAAMQVEKMASQNALAEAKLGQSQARMQGDLQKMVASRLSSTYANPTRANIMSNLSGLVQEAQASGSKAMLASVVPMASAILEQVQATPDAGLPKLIQGYALNMKDALGIDIRERNLASQERYRAGQLGLSQQRVGLEAQRVGLARQGLAQSQAQAEARLAEQKRHALAMEGRETGGVQITGYDEQNRPIIQVGGSGPAKMGTAAANMIEENRVKGIEALSRLNEIERNLDPSLQTVWSRLGSGAIGLQSWLGMELAPEQVKLRERSVTQNQVIMKNYNQTVKEQTGTALSPGEAERVKISDASIEDPPVDLPIKLRNSQRLFRNAIIRQEVSRAAGIDPLKSGIDIADTNTLMGMREDQLRQAHAARSQGMPQEQIESAIEMQLRREFGIK